MTTAAQPTANRSTGAGIPFMITEVIRRQLRDRGYTDEDIRNMTPQAAHDALAVAPPLADADATPKGDTITVLTSLDVIPTKTIRRVNGKMETDAAGNTYEWRGEERPVHNIYSLAKVLDQASADPRCIVVRGRIRGGVDRTKMFRLLNVQEDGREPTFDRAAHRWLVTDVDGDALQVDFDPFADPERTVKHVVSLMPLAFHGATCWYQWTSSAGIKPGVRLRLAHWLDTALDDDTVKRWMAPYADFVDMRVYGAIQQIFCGAPPVAEGAVDPLVGRCARSGIVRGDRDVVAVPDIPAVVSSYGHDDNSDVPVSADLAELVTVIGDHPGGMGCDTAIGFVIGRFLQRGSHQNMAELEAAIRAAFATASWDEKAHPPAYRNKRLADLPNRIKRIQFKQATYERSGLDAVDIEEPSPELAAWIAAAGEEAARREARAEERRRKAEEEAARKTAAANSPEDDVRPPAFTDDALALTFAEQHTDKMRYVAAWSKWLFWDGKQWNTDDTRLAYDRARKVCRRAATSCNKDNVAKAVASAKTVAAVERLASADRRLAATVDQWDSDPWVLNTPEGLLDLRTGNLRPHEPTAYLTKLTAVSPRGACPLWRKFLDRIFAGDAELIGFMQRVAGYSLTGVTTEHALFFGYGTGANGKSVLLSTVTGILGDYHRTAPIETFTASSVDRHPTELAGLRGARLVTSIETEEGRRWAESKLKALTGGDPISARFMRQDYFEYVPQFKLFIAGNHKPGLRSVDEAIRRRLNLVPFTVTIPPEERDPELTEKLKAEWAGIMRWMVQGCLEWQRDGLRPPAAVKAATDAYLEAEDAIGAWLEERCRRNKQAWASRGELFTDWSRWAEAAGEYVSNRRRFIQNLEARGLVPDRHREKGRGFAGIELIQGAGAQTHRRPPAAARRAPTICGERLQMLNDFKAVSLVTLLLLIDATRARETWITERSVTSVTQPRGSDERQRR
jgi:putative DNA primase/helicase